MNHPKYITAADAFDQWRDDLLTGSPPRLYLWGPAQSCQFRQDRDWPQ